LQKYIINAYLKGFFVNFSCKKLFIGLFVLCKIHVNLYSEIFTYTSPMNTIEVCLTPALYKHIHTVSNFGVIVIDVLRATTSITTAFDYGVKEIYPVSTDAEAIHLKEMGYLVAAEQDGITLEYADFGNSPFYFQNKDLYNKIIAYKTTNGTQTIKMLDNSETVVIASFLNLHAVVNWFKDRNMNVVLLCSGWKNKFNLEDTLLAGAFTSIFSKMPQYSIECDAAHATLDLWKIAKSNPVEYIQKAMHRERLRKLGLDDVLDFCFKTNISNSIPVYDGNKIININK
jgi:2-phosphosulfolactate phosphatase